MIGGDIRSVRERPSPLTVLLCALLCWLLSAVQVGFFHRVPLLGAPVELVLAAVCYLGWRRGATVGAVSGIVGGFVLDSLSLTGVSLSPVIFVLAGILMGVLAERLFDHPLTYALSLLPAGILMGAWRAFQMSSFVHLFAVMLGFYLASTILYLPALLRKLKKRK